MTLAKMRVCRFFHDKVLQRNSLAAAPKTAWGLNLYLGEDMLLVFGHERRG